MGGAVSCAARWLRRQIRSEPVPAGNLCAVVNAARCWRTRRRRLHGELGDGTKVDRLLPVQVLDLEDAAALGAGHFHSCARTNVGTVLQWGVDWATGLDWKDRPQRATDLGDVVEIAAGGMHTCVRHASGNVSCWGKNDHGQLGDGTTDDHKAPGVVVELAAAVGLGAGENHTCARLAAGGVACWGSNGGGQLGDGTRLDRQSPVLVLAL